MFRWLQNRIIRNVFRRLLAEQGYTPFMRHYTPFMRRIGWRKRRRLRKDMAELKADFQARQRPLDPEGQKILDEHFRDLL